MRNVWHGEIKGPAQESFYLAPLGRPRGRNVDSMNKA
jgi:hypothetical protein